MDQAHSLLLATYSRDTTGAMIGRPKMIQAESKMESDSMVFNMKTQKGITVNTFTQSGEIFVMGEKMKKITKDDYYAFHGRFTTCNLDTPHFAFRTNKMKLINKKMAITGPVHPEFEGVPIPIYIPFGYFPISAGRHSGFLPPTFDVSSQYGLGLQGLGYYKVLSDNFDVAFRANIYSYGGYNLYLTPEYRVRYRYSGRLNLIYQNTRTVDNSGKSAYTESKTYNFQWAHTVDTKAHPGQSFSANVNLMSAKFNQANITNPTAVYNNQINSSIAYSKTF
jgi:lipopolysaccharide assembly outer membrane protein LptD (OstA)